MSLHLIIDGYNLIRQSPELQELDARDLEAGRGALLARLAAYRLGRSRSQVTVVFDGWLGGEPRETRDRRQGMLIIYSRRGERADEVIKRLLAQEGQRAVLVSSDREIQDFAHQVGAAWIEANEFALLHLKSRDDSPLDEPDGPGSRRGPQKKGPPRRLSKSERQRRERLKKL